MKIYMSRDDNRMIVTWAFHFSSIESESRNADDAMSIESRIGEHKPIKRGKGRPPKNASAFDALDIIAEQTLRVRKRYIDFSRNW